MSDVKLKRNEIISFHLVLKIPTPTGQGFVNVTMKGKSVSYKLYPVLMDAVRDSIDVAEQIIEGLGGVTEDLGVFEDFINSLGNEEDEG